MSGAGNGAPSSGIVADECAIEREQRSEIPCWYKSSKGGRILIVGDGQCRGATRILKGYTGSVHKVETIVKPNAVFAGVVEDVKGLAASFGKDDFVIVVAGTADVLRGWSMRAHVMRGVISSLKNTNVYFVSVPYLGGNGLHNGRAYEYNCSMYDSVVGCKYSNIRFIDINGIIQRERKNIHLTLNEKNMLFSYIGGLLSCQERELKNIDFFNFDNLTYVPLQDNVIDKRFFS